MNMDLQRASMLKRLSALILDGILLLVAVCGFALLLSTLTGYDVYNQQMEDYYSKYETQFGISFEISEEEYLALADDQRKVFDEAYQALIADQDAMYTYNMVLNLTLLVATASIASAYLVLEFAIPLWLKNGQTIGKKAFGIGLMRIDGVQLTTVQLFIRTVLGKFTLETMIPVYILIMIFFNTLGLTGTLVLGAIALLQIIMLAVTKNRSAIHDMLAGTVAVDLSSQMIFRSSQELLDYKKRLHEEEVTRKPY